MSGLKNNISTPSRKSEKKSPRKTYRFTFTLSDPSEDSCSVFDYIAAVKLEEKKLLKKQRQERENKANGSLNPFNNDEENDDDVRRLARKFEDKYGEKKSRSKSYAELGAGYDETDPFIDNTEAYDEELEEDQETPCGGYYINCGPLELKKVDVSDQSDTEEVAKRKHKKALPTIDEMDDEDEEEEKEDEEEEKEEKAKNEGGGRGENVTDMETEQISEAAEEEIVPVSKMTDDLEEKKYHETEIKVPQITNDSDDPTKRRKRPLEDVVSSGQTPVKVKKVKTVKALLEEKRVQETQAVEEPKRQVASSTSINDAIESVVKSSHQDENSDSSSTYKTGTSSEDSNEATANSEKLPPPLPKNLSSDLMKLVENIRITSAVTDNKPKIFCPEINLTLEKIEWKSRELTSANHKLLFAHLAFYLPCTKDTLMRRAKKLFIVSEERKLEILLSKLKATIDAVMPSLEEKYEKERQRIVEAQGMNVSPGSQTPECLPKLPRKKFPWSHEIRTYLKDVVRIKQRCYAVLKPRKCNLEEYIREFITTKVQVLWPVGWVKTSSILRESSCSPHHRDKSRHSSSKSPITNDVSRLNLSYPSTSATVTSEGSGADKAPANASDHHQTTKNERQESFSVDCLLKRTHENTTCPDFNTTLSDIMKQEGVVMNGASEIVNNVNSSKSGKVLDLSSSFSNERTAMRASDTVSLNSAACPAHSLSSSRLESEGLERRLSEETTTATDILSQIINESLLAPSPALKEEQIDSSVNKGEELFFDVMQDLKELNHMSSKQDYKKSSYTGTPWLQPTKNPAEKKGYPSAYHKEFLKHIYRSPESTQGYKQPPPYPPVSQYENSLYLKETTNQVPLSLYNNSTHHRPQSVSTHTVTAPTMKSLPNSDDSNINSMANYAMTQPSPVTTDQHILGLQSPLQFGLHNWFPGSEPQSQP